MSEHEKQDEVVAGEAADAVPEELAALTAPVEAGPVTVVDFDLACVHCRYNLRTLAVGAACPECGHAVADSLHGDQLAYADPAWIRVLGIGTAILLAAGVLRVPALLAEVCLGAGMRALMTAGFAVVQAVGVWLLTVRDPRSEEPPALLTVPWGLRVMAVLVPVVQAAWAWGLLGVGWRMAAAGRWGGPPAPALWAILGAAGLAVAATVGQLGLFYTHLGRLARRVPDPRLARQCGWVFAGLASSHVLLMACYGGVALCGYWFLGRAIRAAEYERMVGYLVYPIVGVSLVLGFFSLWAVGVLLSFHNTFARLKRYARFHAGARGRG